MIESISSRGYDSLRLQGQLVIPETVCLACVWSIWHHECTEWLSRSKRNSVHTEASPWSCSRVAPFFSASGDAILLFATAAACPMPPVAERTSGVKDPLMLNLNDPLLICPPLLILIPSVHNCQGGFAVAWHKRVEHPYVKKCMLLLVLPKSLGTDICPGLIFCVCSQELQLLVREWLKCWLYRDTRTDLCMDVCSDVPDVSSCRIGGSPSQWQLNACSTLSSLPQVQCKGK